MILRKIIPYNHETETGSKDRDFNYVHIPKMLKHA